MKINPRLLTRFSSKHLRIALQYGAYWLVVTAALFVIFHSWGYDDPYITYRYADNLAHGLGFVYNPGERILSTTTPLFALLLTIPAAIYHDLPRAANLISAASIALGGLLVWDIGRTLNSRLASWAGLLLYPTFMLLAMTIGSETPLYLALCMAAFAAFARQRYTLAAAASALALLTRPDGVLVPAILALAYLPELRRRSFPWRSVLVFLMIALPWYLFAWSYFGSPIPATLATKQEQARMVNSLTFTPGFLNILKWFQENPVYWLEALLAFLGAAWIVRKDNRWRPFLAWPVIYFLGYHFLQVSTYYWYYAPLVPPLLAACGLGLDSIARIIQTRLQGRAGGTPAAPWGQWAMIAVLAVFSAAQFSDLWALHLNPDQRLQIYRQTGRWLAEHAPADSTVATIEIGIIGYYAQRYMIDFAGLLQPDIAAQLASSSNYDKLALRVSNQYQPDFLVVRKSSFTELEASYIAAHCQLAQRMPGQNYSYSGTMLIYDCR